MKRIVLILMAALALTLTSCYKESEYTITYRDPATSVAIVTIFEYDSSYDLVRTSEIKYIEPDKLYSRTSSDLARYIVIGVEGTVNERIIEWYSSEIYELDHSRPLHIEVDFQNMDAQSTNPVNPLDCVQRYLHK